MADDKEQEHTRQGRGGEELSVEIPPDGILPQVQQGQNEVSVPPRRVSAQLAGGEDHGRGERGQDADIEDHARAAVGTGGTADED